jgi:hypothetical protein
MTVNPRTSAIINVVLAVLGIIAGMTAQLTPVFGAGTTQLIVTTAGSVVTLYGIINGTLHGVSAPVAGPLVKS